MSSKALKVGQWVRRFHPAPDAVVRVVFFPHAGGASTFFFHFSAALSGDTPPAGYAVAEALSVQYPGRQDRRAEPCIDDLTKMADLAAVELLSWADRPVALFGHSMGALLAFEISLRMAEAGAGPVGLFASGHRPPSLHKPRGDRRFDDEELVADLRRLGGTRGGVLDDEEAVRLVLPCLRSDYGAMASYPSREGSVGCPIVALTGDADPEVTVDEASVWRTHTTSRFEQLVYPGDHFYLASQVPAITRVIRDQVQSWLTETTEVHPGTRPSGGSSRGSGSVPQPSQAVPARAGRVGNGAAGFLPTT